MMVTWTRDVITLGCPDTPVASPLSDTELSVDGLCDCELDPGPLDMVAVGFNVLEPGVRTLPGGGRGATPSSKLFRCRWLSVTRKEKICLTDIYIAKSKSSRSKNVATSVCALLLKPSDESIGTE